MIKVVCPKQTGDVTAANIRVTAEPGWFLKRLVVHDTRTAESISIPCNCWLSSNTHAGDDFRSSVTIEYNRKSKINCKNDVSYAIHADVYAKSRPDAHVHVAHVFDCYKVCYKVWST